MARRKRIVNYKEMITFFISTDQKAALTKYCDKNNISYSQVMRNVVDEYIEYTDNMTNKEMIDKLVEGVKNEPIIEYLDIPQEFIKDSTPDDPSLPDDKSKEILRIEVSTSLKKNIYDYLRSKELKLNMFAKISFNEYLSKHKITGVKKELKNRDIK